MRLVRGLWQVEATWPDRLTMEPRVPLDYDLAAILAPMLGEDGALRAILRRVPGTRAVWESRAPFEASDNPRWGEE